MSTREFQYQDGTSAKFWRITVAGQGCTVQFGRIGTAGQIQTKTFPDAQAAQTASDRQIAEKLKKGYREVGATPDTTAIAPGTSPHAQPTTATPSTQPEPRTRKARQTGETTVYDPTVRLNLDPKDWFWATWRRSAPLERPPAPPFDRAGTLQRLRDMPSMGEWKCKWEDLIAEVITPEEAVFWLQVLHEITEQTRQPYSHSLHINWVQLVDRLETSATNMSHLREQAFAIMHRRRSMPHQIMLTLFVPLFSPQEIMEWLIQAYKDSYRGSVDILVEGFRQYVLPYLSHDERDQLSRSLTPHLKQAPWRPDAPYYFAAMLGGHNDTLLKLAQVRGTQEIIFGLDDPREVEAQFRGLKLPLCQPEYIRAWLAHTEDRALDVVCASIQTKPDRESAVALSKAFALIVSPAAAPHMLLLSQESQAPWIARAWLNAHPAHTIAGLLPVADGGGAQAEAATELLRRLVRRGYGKQIEQALAALPADVAARQHASVILGAERSLPLFDEQTTHAWLSEALRALPTFRQGKLPVWARPSELPPIKVGAHVLNVEQTEAVLRSVQGANQDQPDALITALKQHADQPSLDHFAWSLFEEWLAEGAPGKDNWAFFGLGRLGGDAIVLKLAPLICAWPGENQSQRAANGLDCLRLIGSDAALAQINSIAQKVTFKGLQKRAMECMDRIAEERGLSRAQLDDRFVPDCELDARGERIFDYGPRQFRFMLGPEMKPMLRDPEGKLKPNLPPANSKDDAEKAAQALAEWKLLKQQVAEVASREAARLEQAMITGRRWTRAEFETLLVRHPLMTHLVRALIWGVYDAMGVLSATFRVTEDQSYTNSADAVVETLPADAMIGLIHPLYLPDYERAAWGEILSDYGIVQPFLQIGRPIQRLQAHEQQTTAITHFNELNISAPKFIFGLGRLGWTHDLADSRSCFSGHFKPFSHANLTAVIQHQTAAIEVIQHAHGVTVTPHWIDDEPEQMIKCVAFVPGILQAECNPKHTERLMLGDVDPIVISEVLNDILELLAPTKSSMPDI